MKDENKTKKQLIHELVEMRQRVTELETSEIERKRAEEALRESEEKYRDLVENMDEVIYALDKDGAVTYVSPAVEPFIGYSPSEAMGHSFSEFIYEEDLQRAKKNVQRTLSGHNEANVYRLLTKSGEIRWVHTSSRPIFDGARVIGMQGVLVNITERKRAEEMLRASETEKKAVLDAMSDIVLFQDTNLSIRWGNEAAGRSVGKTPQELVGCYCYELWHGRSEPCEGCPVLRAIETESHADSIMTTPDRRWWEIIGEPVRTRDGKIVGAIEIARDITERKRAEEALAKQTAELLKINERLKEKERLLIAFEQIGQTVLSSLDLERVLDPLGEQIVKTGISRSLMIALVDEQARSVEVVRGFVRLDDGSVVRDPRGVIGFRYDLDDPNITAEVARTGEMQVVVGPDDRFDQRLDRPEDHEGHVAYFIPVKQGDRVLAVLATASLIEEQEEMLRRIEVMRPLLNEVAIALEHARLYRVLGQRAEELERAYRKLQQTHEQLIQAEKLKALGEMASGVAHDFNNVLGGILGWAQLILMHPEDAEEVERGLKMIERSALDGAETVRRIQEFTRIRRDKSIGRADVNEVVRGAVEMTRPKWRDQVQRAGVTIAVEMNLGEVKPVGGSDSELREALINMILNAVDAMPEGGTIRLKTETKEDADGDGEWVYLSISDTGIGMSKEIQQRIFDPFFSTKGAKGDGLGLSVAYGIVTRHGGEISVDSAEGQGTTFTIQLPGTPGAREIKEAEAPTMKVKAMRILVIDDEESIRRVLSEMLESMGHHVSTASGGKAGIERFREEAFDVILTDLGMPEMSGWEIARVVKEVSPATFVFLVTGWGVELPSERLRGSGVHAVMAKPFGMDELSRKIAEVAELKTMHNEE